MSPREKYETSPAFRLLVRRLMREHTLSGGAWTCDDIADAALVAHVQLQRRFAREHAERRKDARQ